MKYLGSFDSTRQTGLVIVFPLGVKGLFNPQVHGLVREVEGLLEGVHVNYALTSGASPTVKDALAAARFAGCDSAVVVAANDDDSAPFEGHGSYGDWGLHLTTDDLSARSVISAYQVALAGLDHAA